MMIPSFHRTADVLLQGLQFARTLQTLVTSLPACVQVSKTNFRIAGGGANELSGGATYGGVSLPHLTFGPPL